MTSLKKGPWVLRKVYVAEKYVAFPAQEMLKVLIGKETCRDRLENGKFLSSEKGLCCRKVWLLIEK